MSNDNELFECPCCGLKILREELCFEICTNCYWEDDPICRDDQEYQGGANKISLKEARENYKKFGACDKESLKSVKKTRKI